MTSGNDRKIDAANQPEPGAVLVHVDAYERGGKTVSAYDYWRGANGENLGRVERAAPPVSSVTPKLSKKNRNRKKPSSPSTEEAHEILATKTRYDRRAIAQDTKSNSVLKILADDDDQDVRAFVAGNKSTPASILRALAKDDDDDVRISVAGNKNTSESTLRALAKDHRSKVRANVARNENTSEDTLQSLTKDDSSIVLSTLARSENAPGDVLETIVEDYNDKMRYSYEDDDDDHLDIDVASNKSAPGYLLSRLAKSDDAQVRFAVTSNPSTPYGILWQLANDDDEHVSRAANDRLDTQH